MALSGSFIELDAQATRQEVYLAVSHVMDSVSFWKVLSLATAKELALRLCTELRVESRGEATHA